MPDEIEGFLTLMRKRYQEEDRKREAESIVEYFQNNPQPQNLKNTLISLKGYPPSVVEILHERYGTDDTQRYKATALINHHHIVKRLITNLITEYEGSACSVDKTVTILEYAYQKFLGNSQPVPQKWNAPSNPEKWITLVGGILSLLLGRERDYLESRRDLAHAYDLR